MIIQYSDISISKLMNGVVGARATRGPVDLFFKNTITASEEIVEDKNLQEAAWHKKEAHGSGNARWQP